MPQASEPIAAAFAILDGVRSSTSQWNIVYDPVHMRVHFRTRSSPAIKTLDAGKLDPSCASAVTLVDIDTDAGGDIAARLHPYDEATNRNLIERSVRRIRRQLPAGAVEGLIAYPAALACSGPPASARIAARQYEALTAADDGEQRFLPARNSARQRRAAGGGGAARDAHANRRA